MSKPDTTSTIAKILSRHPDGVTARQMVDGLAGPGCTRYEAQLAIRHGFDSGQIVLGDDSKMYAPEATNNG